MGVNREWYWNNLRGIDTGFISGFFWSSLLETKFLQEGQ